MPSSDLLTTSEVAELIAVSADTVRRWVDEGHLVPAFRLPGGGLRFRRSDVEAAFAITDRNAAS